MNNLKVDSRPLLPSKEQGLEILEQVNEKTVKISMFYMKFNIMVESEAQSYRVE